MIFKFAYKIIKYQKNMMQLIIFNIKHQTFENQNNTREKSIGINEIINVLLLLL